MQSLGQTAQELNKKSNRRDVQEIVNSYVKVIDAGIQNAHASGFGTYTFDIPDVFNVHNMSRIDAQTFVYSELILIYESPPPKGKGFDSVTLDIHATGAKITIKWQNGLDADERRRRQEIIKRHASK